MVSFRGVLSIALLLPSLTAHAQTAHVAKYSARIEAERDGGVHVSASVDFSGKNYQPISLIIRRIDKQSLSNLTMRDASGRPLVTHARSLESGTAFSTSDASGHWSVDYDVLPTAGVVTKVPLPVPSLSLGPGSTANIDLKVPPGDALYGDLFPRMVVDSNGDAHATALGVPSIALVHHKPAQQISRGESLLTSSNLANLAMLLLLLFGLNMLGRKLKPSSLAPER